MPSGTMGNQIALQIHTRRGDEVIVGEDAHLAADESGAGAAWAGVQFRAAGRGGLFTPDELRAVLQEPDMHCPRQSLVAIENTHNRAGGRVFPRADVLGDRGASRARGGSGSTSTARASGTRRSRRACPRPSSRRPSTR